MKKYLIPVLIVFCAACAPADEPASQADIEAVLGLYVQAVNEADYDLLRSIWISSDEVSYINPLQRLRTVEELEGFWQAGISGRYSERDLRPSNVSIHIAGSEAAWAIFDWEFNGVLSDGQPFHATGWETQIYRLTDHGWKIAHVQFSSPLPPEDE